MFNKFKSGLMEKVSGLKKSASNGLSTLSDSVSGLMNSTKLKVATAIFGGIMAVSSPTTVSANGDIDTITDTSDNNSNKSGMVVKVGSNNVDLTKIDLSKLPTISIIDFLGELSIDNSYKARKQLFIQYFGDSEVFKGLDYQNRKLLKTITAELNVASQPTPVVEAEKIVKTVKIVDNIDTNKTFPTDIQTGTEIQDDNIITDEEVNNLINQDLGISVTISGRTFEGKLSKLNNGFFLVGGNTVSTIEGYKILGRSNVISSTKINSTKVSEIVKDKKERISLEDTLKSNKISINADGYNYAGSVYTGFKGGDNSEASIGATLGYKFNKTTGVYISGEVASKHKKVSGTLEKGVKGGNVKLTASYLQKTEDRTFFDIDKEVNLSTKSIGIEYGTNIDLLNVINDVKIHAAHFDTTGDDLGKIKTVNKDINGSIYDTEYFAGVAGSKTTQIGGSIGLKLGEDTSGRLFAGIENIKYDNLYDGGDTKKSTYGGVVIDHRFNKDNYIHGAYMNSEAGNTYSIESEHKLDVFESEHLWLSPSFKSDQRNDKYVGLKLEYKFGKSAKKPIHVKYNENGNIDIPTSHIEEVAVDEIKNPKDVTKVLNVLLAGKITNVTTTNNALDFDNTPTYNFTPSTGATGILVRNNGVLVATLPGNATSYTFGALADGTYGNITFQSVNGSYVSSLATAPSIEIDTSAPTTFTFDNDPLGKGTITASGILDLDSSLVGGSITSATFDQGSTIGVVINSTTGDIDYSNLTTHSNLISIDNLTIVGTTRAGKPFTITETLSLTP